MRPIEHVPPTLVRRAAAVARGPHACPSCECPTFAEPPVPWVGLRDYVVPCDVCERPLSVRIDRGRILRAGGMQQQQASRTRVDALELVLDTRGTHAFVRRVLLASLIPFVCAWLVLVLGGTEPREIAWASALALFAIIPGALWGPSLVVTGAVRARRAVDRTRRAVRGRLPQRARQALVVEVERGRWDQWQRELHRRAQERREQPDALLRELERVLDERELRRVRALALRGEVPEQHLDDLLRHRRRFVRGDPAIGA